VLAPTKAKVLAEHARFKDPIKGESLHAKPNKAAACGPLHPYYPAIWIVNERLLRTVS